MNNNTLTPKYGLVVMVDALGVRNASIEESIKFIEDIELIQAMIPAYLEGYCSANPEMNEKFEKQPPKVLTFGDTLLFIWECDRHDTDSYLMSVSGALSFLIIEGLQRGLLFRGAMTVGEFIENNNNVLGPAISDVASWYESSQCVGIIATPYCGQFISRIYNDKNMRYKKFEKYSIELKGNEIKDFWIVPWPLYLENDNRKNPISFYYEQIQKLSIPRGTEDKYSNTEALIKHFLKEKFKT